MEQVTPIRSPSIIINDFTPPLHVLGIKICSCCESITQQPLLNLFVPAQASLFINHLLLK